MAQRILRRKHADNEMIGWQTRGERVIRLLIRRDEETLIGAVRVTDNDLRLLPLGKLRCQVSNLFQIMHVAGMRRLIVGDRGQPDAGSFLFFRAKDGIRSSHRRGGSAGSKRRNVRGSGHALNVQRNQEESGNQYADTSSKKQETLAIHRQPHFSLFQLMILSLNHGIASE